MKFLPLLSLLGLLGACQQGVVVAPVTVVATRTPGVSFVVVRPRVDVRHSGTKRVQPGDSSNVNASSWYVLLCDARPADGMHCTLPTEAALARYSYTPNVGTAAAPIDLGVGTLSDFSTHVSRDKDGDDEPGATSPVPVAPASATEIAPAAVAPAASSSAGKGGKP